MIGVTGRKAVMVDPADRVAREAVNRLIEKSVMTVLTL
jgi:hypothetical protein